MMGRRGDTVMQTQHQIFPHVPASPRLHVSASLPPAGTLSCALYLRVLKDIDKRNPNAYHTSRQGTDGGYQHRPMEPAPRVAGRQEAVRGAWWPGRVETSHLYTERT